MLSYQYFPFHINPLCGILRDHYNYRVLHCCPLYCVIFFIHSNTCYVLSQLEEIFASECVSWNNKYLLDCILMATLVGSSFVYLFIAKLSR
jgi:hypothetical protein